MGPLTGINVGAPVKPVQITEVQVRAPEEKPKHPPILPLDVLPPEALSDPEYQTGPNTTAASAHPALALKYGIIRQGTRFVASADNASWGPPPAPNTSIPERVATEIRGPNDFDLASIRELMYEDILNNPEEQRIVESRLPAVDPKAVLRDMIQGKRFRQRVVVVPDVYEPVFEQLPGYVESELQAIALKDAGDLNVAGKSYVLDKYGLWGMFCSLVELRGIDLPSIYDEDRKFSINRFRAKETILFGLPVELLASLSLHYNWFGLRVRKVLRAARDAAKNG